MLAWRVTGAGEPGDVLSLANDVPLPEPQPGLIRVRVDAAGIGRPDLLMCDGGYPLTPPLPFTAGQEVVGTVTAVVPGTAAKVGDRVMGVAAFFAGAGGFAEECLVLDDFALSVPQDMEEGQAAGFVIPYHTAHVGLIRRGRLQAGESVLVLGAAGGTGSAAVQIARAVGAKVIATAGGAEKVAYCKKLGAHRVIDYQSENIAEVVCEEMNGAGVDVVFDAVGGDSYTAATRCVAHEGRILLIGFGSGAWGQPDPAHMVNRNYSVLGVIPASYDREFRLATQANLIDLWRGGALTSFVNGLRPFQSLPETLTELQTGRVCGKLALAAPIDG